MSWYSVYNTKTGKKLKDFDTFKEAESFKDSQSIDCFIEKIIDDMDEWRDLHPSRPM